YLVRLSTFSPMWWSAVGLPHFISPLHAARAGWISIDADQETGRTPNEAASSNVLPGTTSAAALDSGEEADSMLHTTFGASSLSAPAASTASSSYSSSTSAAAS